MSKVLIVRTRNVTPEAEVGKRIAPLLANGWRVISAQTSLAPVGRMDVDGADGKFSGVARHMYYVTTLILERPRPHPLEFQLPG